MYILLRVLGYARNLWPYYIGVTIMSILVSLTALAQPFISKAATDVVMASIESGHAQIGQALFWAVVFLVTDVANALLINYGGYLGDLMSSRLRKQLSERYYLHLLKMPQSFYDTELTGQIINRLNRTINDVTQFLNMFANNFFQMILQVVFIFFVLLFYSWELALLIFVVYPLFMWLTALTSKRWQQWQDEKNRSYDLASGRFAEVISQIRVVKSFMREQLEFRHFERRYQKTVDVTRRQSSYWHKMDVSRRLVMGVIFFLIYAFIFVHTADQRFTVGEMVLLVQLVNMARIPIYSMSFIVDHTQRAISGCKDYFRIMETVPDVADKSRAPALEVTEGKIEYRDVNFAYVEGAGVLSDINFIIKPGEKIALVGESGVGKTTITSLLMRLYDVTSGSIYIDGVNIRDVRQASLRENIAVVFQDPALFSGTIRENIMYGRPTATEKELIRAAKAANAYEFIERLDDKFETEIGERGLKLSGGQKQRIAIARAILKNAPILILDEATSNLDSRAEGLVREALERLMKNRTTLIIAHRLATIADVDRIITLSGGSIDEIGTPHYLARTGGIYAQLLKLQRGQTERDKRRLAQFEIEK